MNNEYLCIAVYSYMNTVLGQKIESAFKLHDFHLGSSTVHQLETISEIHIFAQNKPEPMLLRCLKRENSLVLRLIDIPETTSTWY